MEEHFPVSVCLCMCVSVCEREGVKVLSSVLNVYMGVFSHNSANSSHIKKGIQVVTF